MKKECEIVQDLLFGYSDDILNSESKKIVEEHLKGCKECNEKLEAINNEKDHSDKEEEKVVKCLKKLRRKNIIKTFLIIVGIFVVILLGTYLRKFFIICSIQNKIEKVYESNNIYSEQLSFMGDGKTSIVRKYYKDGKAKEEISFCTDSGETVYWTNYTDLNTKKVIKVTNYTNTYEITDKTKLDERSVKAVYIEPYDGLKAKLLTALIMDIDVAEDVTGEYYVLTEHSDKAKSYELWIDKETGLSAKKIERQARTNFFNGTDIIKEILDDITLYKFSFDTVTNEDVSVDLNTVKELQVEKTLSPFGFAGSSMHRVELWTNGDVYVVDYDGNGFEENNIISKSLIRMYATDIEEDRSEESFGSIIVKGGQEISNVEQYDWIEFK